MKSEKKLLKRANNGDVDAMKSLAKLYDEKSGRWLNDPQLGESVSIDDLLANADKEVDENLSAEAFKWYSKAAALNDAESMREVAHRLYDGIGTPKDEVAAFAMYKKAAQFGNVSAMKVTAHMLKMGLGCDKNDAEAFRWYLKAADAGNQNAAAEVVKFLVQGNTVDKDIAAAEQWLDKLDDRLYRQTLHELTNLDRDNAIMWLDKLVARGDVLALKKKADILATNQNFAEALNLYIAAGVSDDSTYDQDVAAEALVQAANIFYTGDGGKQSYQKAFKFYSMAAAKNYIKGCIHAGRMYHHGLGTHQDFIKAMINFHYAATHRERFPFVNRINSVARELIGRMFERGENLVQNIAQAYRWYDAAATDDRNEELIFRLANDYFYGTNVARDVDRALQLYNEACRYPSRKYFFEAKTKLMWIYELGQNGVERDPAKAAEYRAELSNAKETD